MRADYLIRPYEGIFSPVSMGRISIRGCMSLMYIPL